LKLRYDKLLSSFAFNFNLRHYITEVTAISKSAAATGGEMSESDIDVAVQREAAAWRKDEETVTAPVQVGPDG